MPMKLNQFKHPKQTFSKFHWSTPVQTSSWTDNFYFFIVIRVEPSYILFHPDQDISAGKFLIFFQGKLSALCLEMYNFPFANAR